MKKEKIWRFMCFNCSNTIPALCDCKCKKYNYYEVKLK